jgi:excisionase family DNA binding protein
VPSAETEFDLHQLHTLDVAARRLSLSKRTLQRYIDRQLINVVRLGWNVRISEGELRRLIADGL